MDGLFIESLLRIFPIQWREEKGGARSVRAENTHVARTKEVVFLRSSDANEIIIGLRGSINIPAFEAVEKRSLRNAFQLRLPYCKVLFGTFTK